MSRLELRFDGGDDDQNALPTSHVVDDWGNVWEGLRLTGAGADRLRRSAVTGIHDIPEAVGDLWFDVLGSALPVERGASRAEVTVPLRHEELGTRWPIRPLFLLSESAPGRAVLRSYLSGDYFALAHLMLASVSLRTWAVPADGVARSGATDAETNSLLLQQGVEWLPCQQPAEPNCVVRGHPAVLTQPSPDCEFEDITLSWTEPLQCNLRPPWCGVAVTIRAEGSCYEGSELLDLADALVQVC